MFIVCIVYACYILGYTALTGVLTYIIFIPIQVRPSSRVRRLVASISFIILGIIVIYSFRLSWPRSLTNSDGRQYWSRITVFAPWMRSWTASSSSKCTPGRIPLMRRSQVGQQPFQQWQRRSGTVKEAVVRAAHATCLLMRDSVSLADLRKTEKKQLWVVNFIQNININLTGIVPTIATVLTFLVHTLLGLSLNTTDVSTAAGRCLATPLPPHTHISFFSNIARNAMDKLLFSISLPKLSQLILWPNPSTIKPAPTCQ